MPPHGGVSGIGTRDDYHYVASVRPTGSPGSRVESGTAGSGTVRFAERERGRSGVSGVIGLPTGRCSCEIFTGAVTRLGFVRVGVATIVTGTERGDSQPGRKRRHRPP